MTSTNPNLRRAAVLLERGGKSHKATVWTAASRMLNQPTSLRVEVNVGRLSRIGSEGGALLVPGKVLGWGTVDKKLVVGAFAFSSSAREKIEANGGSAITIEQLVKKYPDGSRVRLVQ